MRKIMFVMLVALATAFISCNKTNQGASGTQATAGADLPLKASQYIDSNYPDASIVYVVAMKNSAAAYIATLNTTEELAFTGDGNYLGDGTKYHDGHHGGDTIFHDSIHGDTIHGGGCGGGGHHGRPGGHHQDWIPVDSLSQLIKDYVTANFPAYTIRHAEFDSVCPEGVVTEVFLFRAGQEPFKLVFDAASAFLMQDNRILYADVPQAVKDYITANYTAYSVCHRSSKLTMADNTIQFVIHLRMSGTHLTVRLQADGTLVCVR
jgi:hypothetical protein